MRGQTSVHSGPNSAELILGSAYRLITIAAVAIALALLSACGGGGGGQQPPAPAVTISLSPTSANLSVGESHSFVATVQNANNLAVSWEVQEGALGGAVTAAGVYTAPLKAGSYHVVAKSQADPSKSATATVTVSAPAPTFTSSAPSYANEGEVFAYTLLANDPAHTDVGFSLISGPAGAEINGSVLTWTPSHAQSRVSNSFEVKATTAAGGTAAQTFNVTPLGKILGVAIDTYVSANGEVTRPIDLTTTYAGALVANDQGWQVIDGVMHSDGSFEIPGVPAGSYWLIAPGGLYSTSASDLDFGVDHIGRPDTVLAQNGTYIDLSFTGLSPWGGDDRLEIFNPNLNQSFVWSGLPEGDTSASVLWDWAGPLSDAARGDVWYGTQISRASAGELQFEYLDKATAPLAITQADGSTTPMSGALTDAARKSLRLHVLGSQFAALASSIGANAQIHSTSIALWAHPLTGSKGWVGYTQTLLGATAQNPIVEDMDFGDLAYGDPFPAPWARFLTAQYEVNVPFQAAGATETVQVPAEIYVSTTTLPTANQGLGPAIGLVRNVKLNGAGFTSAQTSTTTPTLSWDAPAIGSPTSYRITVYRLDSTPEGGSAYEALVDVYTKELSITIPEGVLNSGEQYFFAVRSYRVPGVDLTTSPYRAAFPWAHADLLTPVLSAEGGATHTTEQASSIALVRSAASRALMRANSGNGSRNKSAAGRIQIRAQQASTSSR